MKKIADPGDGFCRQRLKMPAFPVSIPNVVSAWCYARLFLSTGQPLFAEFQANNKRANITTRSLEEGAATRGRWPRAGVAGRSLDAGSWQFVSPPGGSSRVRDLFRILLLNPVEKPSTVYKKA